MYYKKYNTNAMDDGSFRTLTQILMFLLFVYILLKWIDEEKHVRFMPPEKWKYHRYGGDNRYGGDHRHGSYGNYGGYGGNQMAGGINHYGSNYRGGEIPQVNYWDNIY
jgi:hypothetical protein